MKILALAITAIATLLIPDADAGMRRGRHRERHVVRHRERHVERGGCRAYGPEVIVEVPPGDSPKCVTDEPTVTPEPIPESGVEVKVDITSLEKSIVVEVNKRRSRHGLKPFDVHVGLCQGCRSHCHRQHRSRSMFHARGGFSGECVAVGQPTAVSVVNSWMNSRGHRSILLSQARYCGASGVGGYWTLRTLR